MSVNDLLRPYRKTEDYWYLVPRAFWPYPERIDGIPGFHYFLKTLMTYQESETSWDREKEMEVLVMLEDKKITPIWSEQEDYHAHFRNRINFAKKMGFAVSGENRPLALTSTGKHFLESDKTRWPEIFEHQVIRFQFTNPSMPDRYKAFSLFPYMFTLSLLLELDYISIEEFVFHVTLSKSHKEKEEVLNWIHNFRKLPEPDIERARSEIDLNRNYSARMILLLFAYTPSLDFVNNTLIVTDKERARTLLAKCWPHLTYTKYKTAEEWISKFGNFDQSFWPLLPDSSLNRQKKYKKYAKREESDDHKKIKRYVIEKCETIFGKGAQFVEEEYFYASGDRANVILRTSSGTFLAVEVEVNVGRDEIVGLLQAIKYRYMYAAQEGLQNDQVVGILVARKIHERIKQMCVQYDIHYYEQSTGDKSFRRKL